MSNTLPILIAASVFAGGAGAVATTVLLSSPNSNSSETSVTNDNTEVLAAIEVLREESRNLIERVESLEIGAELAPVGGAARTAPSLTRAELDDILSERFGAESDEGVAAVVTPEFLKSVDAAIEIRDERKRLEREQKRAEDEAKRMEDRLAKLQTDLGLDQNQVNSMRTIFQDQDLRREEARTKAREARDSGNMDMGDMRQVWTDMQNETNQALQGVLTPSQYEQYQESNQNQRFGGRGGNNGGGRRGR